MKITARLIVSLLASVTFVVGLYTWVQSRNERRLLLNELDQRASLLSTGLEEALLPLLPDLDDKKLGRIVERFANRKGIVGLAIFSPDRIVLAKTQTLEDSFLNGKMDIPLGLSDQKGRGRFYSRPKGKERHGYFYPIQNDDHIYCVLAIFHDAAHIRGRMTLLWQREFVRFLVQSFLICLITVLIIRWNILFPLYRAADWIKDLRLGLHNESMSPLSKDIFGPLAKEVSQMAKSLTIARQVAEEEARLRQSRESLWTAERLKEHVRSCSNNNLLFVVSNREPYVHNKKGKDIEYLVPAGGLITALEPILRACNGTWIAHGSGDADSLTVDKNDRLQVPPDDPHYTLRRVWLSKEEEDGYYYGFSNEGMWPLCHIAHTRPLFEPHDWETYQKVNRKFADITLEEIKDTSDPWILVQDYHFALLPRYIKEKRPDARVCLFWHIPWPNPESFGICPWARELLDGMLGADLLGFHIQSHCNNFLDTTDRYLESRIDWEHFSVSRQGHTTWVKPFPISIDFAKGSHGQHGQTVFPSKEQILKDLGVKAKYFGIGVDRLDYTKGILERFRGIERFFEKNPDYVGQFTFVELGAPSRTLIKRYHDLTAEIEAEVDRINWRFKTKEWAPIIFLKKNHSHKDIEPFYRAADLCLVTSLHDGMNLVAKEYVAARHDNNGVLVLSGFAGASRELRDAIIVNPYDIDQLADSIFDALTMSPDEQQMRMRQMRLQVRNNNVYQWAASLISELSTLRKTNSDRRPELGSLV